MFATETVLSETTADTKSASPVKNSSVLVSYTPGTEPLRQVQVLGPVLPCLTEPDVTEVHPRYTLDQVCWNHSQPQPVSLNRPNINQHPPLVRRVCWDPMRTYLHPQENSQIGKQWFPLGMKSPGSSSLCSDKSPARLSFSSSLVK